MSFLATESTVYTESSSSYVMTLSVIQDAADMLKLLLDHHADTTLLCNGHSPLSLAIVSGNDKVSCAPFYTHSPISH